MGGKKIEKRYQAWHDKQAAEKVPPKRTLSGIEIPDLFVPGTKDQSEDHYLTEIGFPGEFPFTRGVQASMYRGRTWTMRQYAGFGTAAETNARYRYLLSQGTMGLSVAFD